MTTLSHQRMLVQFAQTPASAQNTALSLSSSPRYDPRATIACRGSLDLRDTPGTVLASSSSLSSRLSLSSSRRARCEGDDESEGPITKTTRLQASLMFEEGTSSGYTNLLHPFPPGLISSTSSPHHPHCISTPPAHIPSIPSPLSSSSSSSACTAEPRNDVVECREPVFRLAFRFEGFYEGLGCAQGAESVEGEAGLSEPRGEERHKNRRIYSIPSSFGSTRLRDRTQRRLVSTSALPSSRRPSSRPPPSETTMA
ncbi:hypothetical protein NMY22_g19570 [Coprinellus aureogranulatus]|nr:hypothetical protein NMY22_g19570 [Coprinellus aureogranulatus]